MSLIENVGGRKFVVTATTGFATCILVWFGKIADGIFATVILGTVGAYIVGNVAQKIKGNGKEGSDA